MKAKTFHERAEAVGNLLATCPLIRAINFHNTPKTRTAEFERLLEHCAEHFSPVNEDALDSYLVSGRWPKPKPGLIIALYDSNRNQYDVMAPILERHGFIGWFFVVTEFVKAPVADQLAASKRYDITILRDEYPDGRYALSWEELRELDGKHVIASHARRHTRLSNLDSAALADEVLGSQQDFEEKLGHRVRTFVSYGGPAFGEFAPADRLMEAAGYQFVFSNYEIQRLGPKPRP